MVDYSNVIPELCNKGSVALLWHFEKCKNQKCKNCLIHWENQSKNFTFLIFTLWFLQFAKCQSKATLPSIEMKLQLAYTIWCELGIKQFEFD